MTFLADFYCLALHQLRGVKVLFRLGACLLAVVICRFELFAERPVQSDFDVQYTNYVRANVPWSIHVVRWPKNDPHYEISAVHATGARRGA
jgi:hypothetical protein